MKLSKSSIFLMCAIWRAQFEVPELPEWESLPLEKPVSSINIRHRYVSVGPLSPRTGHMVMVCMHFWHIQQMFGGSQSALDAKWGVSVSTELQWAQSFQHCFGNVEWWTTSFVQNFSFCLFKDILAQDVSLRAWKWKFHTKKPVRNHILYIFYPQN